jgi:hypothetical protein
MLTLRWLKPIADVFLGTCGSYRATHCGSLDREGWRWFSRFAIVCSNKHGLRSSSILVVEMDGSRLDKTKTVRVEEDDQRLPVDTRRWFLLADCTFLHCVVLSTSCSRQEQTRLICYQFRVLFDPLCDDRLHDFGCFLVVNNNAPL